MSIQRRQFENRVGKLTNQHAALSKGRRAKLRRDGLIQMKPARSRPRLPLVSLTLIAAAFVIFKAYSYAHLGPVEYEIRRAALEQGSTLNKVGAFLFTPDQVTKTLATAFITPAVDLAETELAQNEIPEPAGE